MKQITIKILKLKLILKQINHMLNISLVRNQSKIFLKKPKQFSSKDVGKFLFFQFNSGNAKYFFHLDNKMDIRISDTPHYWVAKKSILDDDKGIEDAKNKYVEYLKSSWPSYGLDPSQAKLDAKYQKYLEFIDVTARAGKISTTILLTQIPGKQGYYVVDGNHTCSIASALDLPVQAKVLDFPLAFDQFMRVDEFYGMKNKNMPYQSVYIDKHIVRKGRRDDIYDRLDFLPDEILNQKTILDVGCNMGMNAIGAFKSGARKVVGLEVSKRMVNFATRFAVLDKCFPDVEFRQFDVDNDQLPNDEKYDVAFMLSIHHHLKNYHALVEIVRNNVVKAVIFEGHPNTKLSDYTNFLDAVQFSKIEKIADLSTSVFDRNFSRPLWILYK